MGNCYAVVDDVRARLGITVTTEDPILLSLIEAASRRIDNDCNRHFYIWSGTRYFDGADGTKLWIDDFLSLSALVADTDADYDWTDQVWVEGTHWSAWPYNKYPKRRIDVLPNSIYSLTDTPRLLKGTGLWGYGDGTSTSYKAAGITGTVATTSGTSLTLNTSNGVKAGQTILLDSEQMFVVSVSTTTATVERAVNGTIAATHTASQIYIYQYPADLSRLCLLMAIEAYKVEPTAGMLSENIGDYSYSRVSAITDTIQKTIDRVESKYIRARVA